MDINDETDILATSTAHGAQDDFAKLDSDLNESFLTGSLAVKIEPNPNHVISDLDKSEKLESMFREYVSSNDGEHNPSDDDEEVSDHSSVEEVASLRTSNLSEWSEEQDIIVTAPFDYVSALPQKDFRRKLLEAVNVWFQVDSSSADTIAETVAMLHNASLLIDDIQDGSTQRRGHPVAHEVFGVAQTINSANYVYFKAQMNLYKLAKSSDAVQVFTEELLNLHRGQGLELWWRDTFSLPDENAYLGMVAGKTGGLFRLVVRLLQSQSSFEADVIPLIDIVGLIFQILDDYKSLLDAKMASQKEFCEDLTEGKFSYPIIHGLRNSPENGPLANIVRSRPTDRAKKQYVLQLLEEQTDSFAYTRRVLDTLHGRARVIMGQIEPRNPAVEKILDWLRDMHENISYKSSM